MPNSLSELQANGTCLFTMLIGRTKKALILKTVQNKNLLLINLPAL